MKQIIVETTPEVVSVENVRDNNYVGVQWDEDGDKAWIMQTKEGFIVTRIAERYINNCTVRQDAQTLIKLLHEHNEGKIKFFKFDNHIELTEWLIKE